VKGAGFLFTKRREKSNCQKFWGKMGKFSKWTPGKGRDEVKTDKRK